jgi:putative ABC transport system permease protein
MLDGLQEIWFTIKQNKLRTLLTAFGVFWGIFMLIILLGAGRGMQNGVMQDFGSDVLDFIVIHPRDTSVAFKGMGPGRKIKFVPDDVAALRDQVDGIRVISGNAQMWGATVTYQDKNSSSQVQGAPDDFFRVKEDVPFNFGRKVNRFDGDDTRKIAVIGTAVAERLFTKGVDPIGREIRVRDMVVRVVGVFHDKGNRGRNSETVYIPLTTFHMVFGFGQRIDAIWLRPAAGVDGFDLEKRAVEHLKRRHSVSPDDRRGIDSFNMAEPAKRVNGLFLGINIFIWFVGLGTLTAGIVGISNIMIITVKERTREIGIRKALGATPFSIVSTLLLESTLVTAFAGYLGLVFGVGLIELIAWFMRKAGVQGGYFVNPEVNFGVAMTAIALLIGVGLLAGLMPALRAAKITPIEAMRAE